MGNWGTDDDVKYVCRKHPDVVLFEEPRRPPGAIEMVVTAGLNPQYCEKCKKWYVKSECLKK